MNAFFYRLLALRLAKLVLMASLGSAGVAGAASVTLATSPLANSTNTTVLPNLLFILDNSGSMGQEHTPDWIMDYNMRNDPWKYNGTWNSPGTNEKNCKDSADDDGSINTAPDQMDMCVVGDVPFMTSAINTQYYNPAIRYQPGSRADGTSYPSQTDPTSVLTDGYGKHNQDQLGTDTTTINLTTSYPDRIWCTKNNPTAAELANTAVCRKNSDYLYPNATFKYGRDSNSTTSYKNVLGVFGAPYYYRVVVTEHCSEPELRNCVSSSTPTGSYTFPALSRWCSNTALTACQSVKTATFKYPRYPGASVTAVAASGGKFRVGSSTPRTISSVKFTGSGGTIEILGASVTGTSRTNLATQVANQINTFASNPEFTASTCDDGTYVCLTSTTAAGATGNGSFSVTGSAGSSSFTNTSGGITGLSQPAYSFARTDIEPGNNSYPKAPTRTDCTGSTCTYAEEITNFGNWYAYYRTRMQSMKSSVSLAFKPIGSNYRVGFMNICKGDYLPIRKFEGVTASGQQKFDWYAKLFNSTAAGCGTPLRSALATAGRVFAGKELSTAGSTTGSSIDPIQYACQQNFALLTTDGYWNTDSSSTIKNLTGGSMGNLDGGTTARPMYEGPTASTGSLADVAKYYYDTDLRTSGIGNCAGSLGISVCQEDNLYSKQNMVTFSLGLGVDGTIAYTSDYKTATSGDYYNIKNGLGTPTANWPVPAEGTETTVDDLWHAAVNGGGTYFSAKDPAQLGYGLNAALKAMDAQVASAAAAATSTLNPVAGNNFAYVASYSTVKWTGNLESRKINIDNGLVSESASWCVESLPAGSCPAPGVISADNSGSSTIYNCVTPGATPSTCVAPAVLDGTNCRLEMPVACTGTMPSRVSANTDSRTIYIKGSGSLLASFTYANLNPAHFTASGLSQWSLLTPDQQSAATGANLVNYLRGQYGYEERSSNPADNRLYRYREATMGDALESQPVFVGAPIFTYADPGYIAFKAAKENRAGTVYMGTNDGMLHAFNAVNGSERWAYVPTEVIPNLWKLADKNYASQHTNFVNGSPFVSDICVSGCADAATAVWKTILVGGLNAGGRSYYALDVTNPDSPQFLWEFGTANDSDLGYTYGTPIITKKSDGTWVVLVTSGYNNTSPGNGKGYLYVLNAGTGAVINKIATNVGDTTTPSGLGKIAGWADYAYTNNSITYAYGGDLMGNLWRFDVNAGTAFKFATLKDSSGVSQPVTTAPTLGKINGKRVIFVGTGKYLETSDLTNTDVQSLYAIKDDSATATLSNPRGALVGQSLSNSGDLRYGSSNPVDWSVPTTRGWYVDFPDGGERANIQSRLVQGTLIVPTIVPRNTVCSPGGYGWVNYFNYETGTAVIEGSLIGSRKDSPIVGVNVIIIKGKPLVEIVTSNHPTPEIDPNQKFKGSGSSFSGTRVLWREITR